MASRRIKLQQELAQRCAAYGQRTVDDYLAGYNAASRAVTCFDAHSKVELQSLARMAECAFCLWGGLDIEQLNWTRGTDGGSDVIIPANGWRVDVKHTKHGERLIWPIGKNHLLNSKKFDILSLVIGDNDRGFEVAGWIAKQDFIANHHTAPQNHDLVAGTKFLNRVEIKRPWSLQQILERGVAA